MTPHELQTGTISEASRVGNLYRAVYNIQCNDYDIQQRETRALVVVPWVPVQGYVAQHYVAAVLFQPASACRPSHTSGEYGNLPAAGYCGVVTVPQDRIDVSHFQRSGSPNYMHSRRERPTESHIL